MKITQGMFDEKTPRLVEIVQETDLRWKTERKSYRPPLLHWHNDN